MINQLDLDDKNIYNVIDLLNISIYWKDVAGRYLGCNKYMLNMAGLSNRKEVIGKTDHDLIWKDSASKLREADEFAMKNGFYEIEEYGTVNGGERTYLTNKARLLDGMGNLIGVFGTSTDITNAKKQMELEQQRAILNERSQIQQIIDLVDASIYWKDKEGHILGCNRYVLNMFGMKDHQEIIGKTDYDISTLDDANTLAKVDKLVLKKGFYCGEEPFTAPDGTKNVYFTSKNRLLDNQGNIIGIIGASLDITGQKEAEKLRLEKAKHEAAAKEQAKFRKDVAKTIHDIQSPLTSITTVATSTPEIPESKRITLNHASLAAKDMIRELSNKYKNPNAEDERRQPILVSVAIDNVLSDKRQDFKDSNIQFEHEFDDDYSDSNFLFINIVPSHFERSISNLINNAVQAVEDKPDGKIKVRLSSVGEQVIVTITDNGKGIPPETLAKLNDGVSLTEGKINGSGLGLQQVRETVLKNLGKIDEIESELGKGTEIRLRFQGIPAPSWAASQIKMARHYINK